MPRPETSQNKKKSPYFKRIATAVLGIPLLVLLIYYGTPLHFWLLVTGCILLGLVEFYQIMAQANIRCFSLLGLGLGLLTSIAFQSESVAMPASLVMSLAVIVIFLGYLFSFHDLSTVIPELFCTMGGVFYVAWLLGHLVWIRRLPHGKALIFYLLLVVWAGDTFAFYTGRQIGKHRLSPRISPKKTIEGSIGGIAGSVFISVIAHFTFLQSISLGNCIFLGFFLNIFGQLGDLAESLLKRGAGVKDSGKVLPGHGGILDRIDGVIFASPALFYYAAASLPMYRLR
ncbi:MAG: phosphatidate cytidylyltransferase [bacterium]